MENKEIILKRHSIELNGDLTAADIIMMFSCALKAVRDTLEKELGDEEEDIDYCLGTFIHSIIAGKTDEEIARIFTQAELIRQDYEKFMKNK
jgi:hypothetical protein